MPTSAPREAEARRGRERRTGKVCTLQYSLAFQPATEDLPSPQALRTVQGWMDI